MCLNETASMLINQMPSYQNNIFKIQMSYFIYLVNLYIANNTYRRGLLLKIIVTEHTQLAQRSVYFSKRVTSDE